MSEDTHHCDGCAAIDQLRKELDQKHSQNRSDIHKFRNEMQGVLLEVTALRGKILPIIGGDGQPGILAQLRTELEGLRSLITDLRIAQGADAGRRGEFEWLRAILGSAVVGGLLILAQHAWK
jgi:hypothetical protein